MRPGRRGRCAAAGALTLLPLLLTAHAGGLRPSRSCSMADAHASRAAVPADGAVGTSEAAITAEALRPLPAVAAVGGAPDAVDAAIDVEARTVPRDFTVPTDVSREAVAGPPEPLQAVERSTAVDVSGAPEDAPLAFRDYRAPKERFRAWRELRVLRLWDDTRITVWFGLDRKGRPGLHFRQRNPGEAVPAAPSAAFTDAPPLRSVPLSGP